MELGNTIGRDPIYFQVQNREWGCFWQEKPEDAVALYREMMSTPVFCYLHTGLWCRDAQRPRLAGWNEDDRNRIPTIWNKFLTELDDSTNLLMRLEAKAFRLADADNPQEFNAPATNFFGTILENRDELVAQQG